jgi:hypothetical protein
MRILQDGKLNLRIQDKTMMAIASRKLSQIHAAMRRKRLSLERACMVKSYHGGLFKGCVCRHALDEVPMTGVMPFDEDAWF